MPAAAVLGLFCLFALFAAGSDLWRRRIPNWLSAITAVTGLGLSALDIMPGGFLSQAAHMAISLVAGMVLFKFGLWGGGDAKIYSALAAWFPLSQALDLLLATALAGFGLVAISWVVAMLRRKRELLGSLPYGVAIGAGGVATMALAGSY